MTLTFDPALFRARFAEFADPLSYLDLDLQTAWDMATFHVSNESASGCGGLTDGQRTLVIQLMAAHMLRIAKAVDAAGAGTATTGVVTGATIDKVNVTLMPPPARDTWAYWLAQSNYGQQLAALLQGAAVGGFYVGGNPERAAFRKVGGVW